MRFILFDRVTELVAGERISAVKCVSLSEEYLADHFPSFAVMPGVLMLEALVQTAAMLVRVTNGFAQSMIVLEEARNVKYTSFVKPGDSVELILEAKSIDAEGSRFFGEARVGDRKMVEARLQLRHFNLRDEDERLERTDRGIVEAMRSQAKLVGAC